MPQSHWKIWTTAKSPDAALRVYDRVVQQLEVTPKHVEKELPAQHDEWLLRFTIEMVSTTWEGCIVEVITLGQRIAYEWTLFGDIRQDPSGWSTKPRTTGVRELQWALAPSEHPTPANKKED